MNRAKRFWRRFQDRRRLERADIRRVNELSEKYGGASCRCWGLGLPRGSHTTWCPVYKESKG